MWSRDDSHPLWQTGIHLREFFRQEEAINYKAAILIDLRKIIFILAQEKVERNPKHEHT